MWLFFPLFPSCFSFVFAFLRIKFPTLIHSLITSSYESLHPVPSPSLGMNRELTCYIKKALASNFSLSFFIYFVIYWTYLFIFQSKKVIYYINMWCLFPLFPFSCFPFVFSFLRIKFPVLIKLFLEFLNLLCYLFTFQSKKNQKKKKVSIK